MANGRITRPELVEDKVFLIGADYAKSLDPAIAANKALLDSFRNAALEYGKLESLYKNAKGQKEFLSVKEQENQTTKRVTAAISEQERAERALERTKERKKVAQTQINQSLQKERFELQQVNRETKQNATLTSKVATEYQKQSAKLAILRKSYKDLSTRQEIHKNLTKKEVLEMRKLEAQANKIDTALKKVDKSVGQSQRNVGNYSSAFGNLTSVLRTTIGAFGIYSGLQVARELFNQIKEVDGLNKALLKVTETQAKFNLEQGFLIALADEAGVELTSLQGSYTKFLASAKTTNLTVAETQNIFRQTAKAGAVLGLTTDDINGSFRALEQILSKGKVQAEEIRGQLGERLPGAFQILAQSMGLTTQELSKQLELGNVISEEVLPKFAEELEKVYGLDTVKKVDTLVSAQNRLSNAWTEFVLSVENGEGVISKAIKTFLDETTKAINFYRKLNSDGLTELQTTSYKNELKDIRNIAKIAERDEKEIAKNRLETKRELLKASEEELAQNEKNIAFYKESTPEVKKYFPFNQTYLAVREKQDQLTSSVKTSIAQYKGQIAALEELTSTKEKEVKVDEKKLGVSKAIKEQRDFELDLIKFINQQKIDYLKDFAEDELNSFENRQTALEQQAKLEIELAEFVKKEKLRKIKKGSDEEKLIVAQTNAEIREIKAGLEDSSIDLEVERLKANAETEKAIKEKQLNEELERENTLYESTLDQYKTKEEAVEASEKRISEIKKKYALEALFTQIDALEQLLESTDLTTEQRAKYEKELSDIILQVSEATTDKVVENDEKEVLSTEQKIIKIGELSAQLADTIGQLADTISQNRINEIQEEIDKHDEKTERYLENEALSEEQREEISTKREEERKILEKKKAEEVRKQAALAKALAVFTIGINTATAIIGALAPPPIGLGPVAGIPLAISTGVLGAIQLAAALAKPIPKYAKGTDYHKGGFAEVAEERPEVITEPNKAPYIVHKRSILDLPQGTKVTPSLEEYQMLMRASTLSSIQISNQKVSDFQAAKILDYNTDKLEKEMQLTRKAIQSQKTNIRVNQQKVDINHELFRFKNTNWS